MKTKHGRQLFGDLRKVRLNVPDARTAAVRARVAAQVARLNPGVEEDALNWIEAVSEFDLQHR